VTSAQRDNPKVRCRDADSAGHDVTRKVEKKPNEEEEIARRSVRAQSAPPIAPSRSTNRERADADAFADDRSASCKLINGGRGGSVA